MWAKKDFFQLFVSFLSLLVGQQIVLVESLNSTVFSDMLGHRGEIYT